jgi:DtxR family Mn-dependent transcriptional regulator
MKIHESAENYLESILILQKQNGYVRSVDIANSLGFSKPSVSVAMKQLKENRYITVNGRGRITLTEAGMKIASRMYERHTLLTRILIKLGVDEETARADACRIEHVISETTFEKLKKAFEGRLDFE